VTRRAVSSADASCAGSNRIIGTTTGSAPADSTACARSPACSSLRVTSTRRPKSGRRSNHASSLRSNATSPTTITAGACTPASRARSAIWPSGASTTR
jgi:hypothetical protein